VSARHLVVVVLDSCRFDAFVEARPRSLARLGEIERRWSYASWTSPSHFNLLMGLLPHRSPKGVFASDVYRGEYRRFEERLGIDGISFPAMLPHLWLPELLQGLGYRTEARVSLPVLNPATPINRAFDRYELMERHNDMAAMLPTLPTFDHPTFLLLNVGETHYPYALPDEPEHDWPRIHGLHGVLGGATSGSPAPFEVALMFGCSPPTFVVGLLAAPKSTSDVACCASRPQSRTPTSVLTTYWMIVLPPGDPVPM